MLAAAGGFIVGGVGSGLVGGTLGFKEMLRSLLPNVALGFTLVLLGITNPFVLIPALFAAGSIQGVLRVGAMTKEIATKVGQELASRLRDSAEETADKAALEIFTRTEALMKQVDEGLEKEISAVKESVESVLAAKRKGEARTKERAADLDEVMSVVKALQADLDDMIFAVQSKS